ncbi:MAG: TIR domain-containing protein, partial [Vicinamibacterales bacterium]
HERVVTVVDALQAAGVDIWMDERDIAVGSNYGSEIGGGIRGCAALALMWTPASLASRNVRQEIMLAWKYERPYLPLLLDPEPIPSDLEYWLEGSQWIEVLDHPAGEWLPRVLQAIAQIEIVAPASRVPEPPVEAIIAPATVAKPKHNLPTAAPIVGRAGDVAAIVDLILNGANRLVTLTGPGGTGKTRLAIQVARALLDAVEEIIFVPLAPISEGRLVLATIARVLEGSDAGGRSVEETIVERLGGRRVLLVLDNFEQVVDAAVDIGPLIAACSDLRILVTSRLRLGLYEEQEYPVAPLALPSASTALPLDALGQVEAVALFVQRVRLLKPDFHLSEENAAAVAEIARKLDGLPLAIELAAARGKVLTPQAMLARMTRVLPLLTGGARDLPARQQTLRGAITWSYDLLTPDEQHLFRQLSVFRGGWTLDGAEAVVGSSDDGGGDLDVLLLLDRLLEHSLVREHEDPDGGVRYDMLATIREYGYEQLEAAGEAAAAEAWQMRYVGALVAEAEPHLDGQEAKRWLDRLEAEHNNLRAAIEWCLAHDPLAGLQLTIALNRYWYMRGYLAEPCRWLEALLDSPIEIDPALRARALRQAGAFFALQNRPDDARRALELAVAHSRDANDREELAYALNNQGGAAFQRGDFDAARNAWLEGLAINRTRDVDVDIARVLANIANLDSELGDYQSAAARASEAIEFARRASNELVLLYSLTIAGMGYLMQGSVEQAAPLFTEALVRNQRLGDRLTIIDTLENVVAVMTQLGPPEQAARVAGAAHAARLRVGSKRTFDDQIRQYEATLSQQLGEERWRELWTAGQALSLDEASAEALEVIALVGVGS